MENIFGIPANDLLIALLVLLGLIVAVVAYTAIRYPVPFRLGIRNLSRRKSQTALIIAGLALSTLIITSALAIGDTVDYSVKSGVFDGLGGIDEQISATSVESAAGFGFGSNGPAADVSSAGSEWFAASIAAEAAELVGPSTADGSIIDGLTPAAIQSLPVLNSRSNLSESAAEIRGLGPIIGDGLAQPAGLSDLADGQVLVNNSLAEALDVVPGDELLLVKGMPSSVTVAGIVPDGELAGAGSAVLWSLASSQAFFDQPNQITDIFVSNVGDAESGVEETAAAVASLESVAGDLIVNQVKADQLEVAASSAEFITTLFVTFGTFSIFSGILLIFLIFSVLAAERKSELGMGRAVGLQRADLVRQFVTEGFAYNFIAALIGATLGVLAALLLAGTVTGLLGASDLNISPRVSPRSAVIGYSLGLVLSFLTITISAVRISRVNIIAAIRDLDLPALPRESQWTLFVRPFTVWRAALSKAGRGNRRAAARMFLLAAPKAVLSFWLGLLARGPVLIVLGYLFAWVGVNIAEQAGVYGLGVSLFIIGVGQFAAWLLVSNRLAYSLTALALILYWSLPTRDVGRLSELGSNPGDFFISGMFLVGGAIMLFLYNADALLNLFAGLLGRLGRLLPVARVSIAYPVKSKGRTATTLAMFSLVVFTLVSTTTITNTFSNFFNSETGSGGYDVLLQSNPFNPIDAEEMAAAVDRLAAEGTIPQPEAFAAALFTPVEAQSPGMMRPAPYAINGVDDAFFASQNLELAGIAEGYADEAAVWAALISDPSLVVVDNFSIDRSGDPTYQPDEDSFLISSIAGSDTEFEPVSIQIVGADGQARDFTVIGVLGSAPSFFGAMMSAAAATDLGFEGANRYFLRLPEDADARPVANAVESEFSRSGLQTVLLKEQLDASRQSVRSIFYLIQGFIGLGLLIGIAALGVITIRAVVERRQQIGVLRAIGFQRKMVQGVFLFEGVFVAGLGTVIGYVLALTFAYNLYLQVAADQGLAFLPPWPALIGIAAAIIVVSIAEALRYE
ncbi:MAG TPA: FtsX-like permease family protein [Anaerolineae bacterium]|nr:FtsX-like permease family protein [Anaerolineae bacterium]